MEMYIYLHVPVEQWNIICVWKNTQHLLDTNRWSTGIPEYGTVHTPGGLLWEDGGTPVYIYQNNGCVDCSGMLLKWHWGCFFIPLLFFTANSEDFLISLHISWCCYIFLGISWHFFTSVHISSHVFTNNDPNFAALPPSGTSSGNIQRHSDVWAGAAECVMETWQSVG